MAQRREVPGQAWIRGLGTQCRDEGKKRQRDPSNLPSGLLKFRKNHEKEAVPVGVSLIHAGTTDESPRGDCLAEPDRGKPPLSISIHVKREEIRKRERTRSHLNFEFAPVFCRPSLLKEV